MHSTQYLLAASALVIGCVSAARGCDNVDCTNVPPPLIINGVVSGRDSGCRYTCYLRRQELEAKKPNPNGEDKVEPIRPPPLEGLQRNDVDPPQPEDWKESTKAASPTKPDLSLAAITQMLRGADRDLILGRAGSEEDGSPPAARIRGKREAQQAQQAQQPDIRKVEVTVSGVRRRSEGRCKFSADVVGDPMRAVPGLICLAGGYTYGEYAQMAARVAYEYDPLCTMSADLTFQIDSMDGINVAKPGEKGLTKVPDKSSAIATLSCGTRFKIGATDIGPSGSNQLPGIAILNDARGILPLLLEGIPKLCDNGGCSGVVSKS